MRAPDLRLPASRVTGASALVVILLGCNATTSSRSEASGVEQAAVRPGGDSRSTAAISGILRADRTTGCLWLEMEGGKVGVELLLQGESYRVDFSTDPASVLDGDEVVGRVGAVVDLGGGFAATGDGVPGCPVDAPPFLGYFD